MRLMLLTAALLAAEADFGAAAAPADPESVQASAPEAAATEQPPVDNDHVAPGCEQFGDPAADAPTSSSSSSSEPANVETGGHAPDPAMSAGDPPAQVGSGTAGAVGRDLRPAPMGAPVIVRLDGRLSPGIVVEEDDTASSGITVQIFRGDHLPHVGHHLQRTTVDGTSDGWFYPWERRSL